MFHVIDDNSDLCDLTAELISELGHQVMRFYNPAEYLSQLSQGMIATPLAIFTDIRMPEIDGHELIREVKTLNPEQKIVVISGFDEELEKSKDSTCHFLHKPYQPEHLLKVVDALIQCDRDGPTSDSQSSCHKIQDSRFDCPLECSNCL